ncbi:MAG: CoA transferase, partial [Ilumatobacteraceae bacterium]
MSTIGRPEEGARRGGPLDGVRVVDLSDSSGRYAVKLLGEMGAEVVRLRSGEPGAPMTTVPGGLLEWWFDGATRALDLDLDSADGRARFLDLVGAADVLIETEPPHRLATLGLGVDRLAVANPRLTHVSLTPFGADGPRAGWQSSDLVMAAAGGILSVNGVPDEPVTMWGRQMDNVGGAYATICALAGLHRARTTGRGMHFDLSHQQAVASCSEHVLMFWWYADAFTDLGAPLAGRQASVHWSRAYEVVPCSRGFCMVSPSAGGVPDLVAWMEERGHAPRLPDDLTDARAVIAAYMAALRAFALELDATDVFQGGQARHVPFGEVLTVAEVVASPQHVERGFMRPVDGVAGDVRVPGPFAHFAGSPCPPPASPRQSPMTDDDVAELLARWASPVAAAPAAGDATEAPPGGTPPLAGIRVIDFTHVLAGPFATRLFADLGAEVLKVQTTVRSQGAHANEYPYFGMWNRSKSSIALNMADDRAIDVLRALVAQADVVIENFSAGVLDEWGAGWKQLSAWNDRIIYLSMHGAGGDGPWRDYVTFAPTVHALSGLTALTGPEGRIDCGTGVALNDHASGLAGAVALLGAIESRRRTGRGQHIDLSQFELASYLVGPALLDFQANGREATAAGTRDAFSDLVPNDVVRTADGRWVAVTARDDDDWRRLAAVIGAGHELATLDVRQRRRDEVRRLLEAWAGGRTADEAAVALQAAGVPASA